jgi:hypothetical protein
LMEERSLAAEGKIRSLEMENEALRLHLKLALESLKNPIPAVAVKEVLVTPAAEEVKELQQDANKENEGAAAGGEKAKGLDSKEEEYYSDGNTEDGFDEDEEYARLDREAEETQEATYHLLQEVQLFKRKIADDKKRWWPVDDGTRRRPLTNILNLR